MKSRVWTAAIFSTALLASCGGGDAGSAGTSGVATGSNTGGSTGAATGSNAGGSAAASPAATITAVSAPADGAVLAGTTLLSISGTNIANAELLPATGATPRLANFAVAADGRSATASFDTRNVPNGLLTLRIAAYNQAAGSAGAIETTAMAGRSWQLSNDPPPVGNDAGRTARCLQMGYPGTSPDPNNPVVCMVYARTSTPVAECTSFGTGYGNPEDLLEVLRNGTRVSKLYCQPGANNGILNEGCSCLS